MLVMTAFIMLVELGMVPAWIAAIIICRELAVMVFVYYLLKMVVTVLAAAMPGKIKNIYSNVFNYFLTFAFFNDWNTFALCRFDFHNLLRI